MSAHGHHAGPHKARVAHSIRGRLRLKVAGTKKSPARLEHIRKTLATIPGVKHAEANPVTGSVLLHYDHAEADAGDGAFVRKVCDFAEQSGLFTVVSEVHDVDQLGEDLRREAEYQASHSRTAEAIFNQVITLNAGLKKATDNAIDLNVAFPLGLGILSAATAGLEAGTPLWVTLALSAFHSFVSLHTKAQRPGTMGNLNSPEGPETGPDPTEQ